MPAAHKGTVHVAKVMAGTALDVLRNPALAEAAKADHQSQVGRTPHVRRLPEDLQPPVTVSA